jgi:DNA-binding response OmpR family regulator
LAYLVNEAPRVIPPQELIREVQGYESDSWEARDTVRSHIYHMRQKIKAATGRQLIRTVRGVGYSLEE